MSLREQKKLRARRAILNAADALITTKGYAQSSMRDIAEAAQMSYQTVYNYFPSKALILQALFTRDVETASIEMDALINQYSGDLITTLNQINEAKMNVVDGKDRSLWREVCIELFRQKEDQSSIYQLVPIAHAQLQTVLRKAQGMGHMKVDVDVELMAHTMFSLSEFAFVEFVMDPNVTRDAVIQMLQDQTELLLAPYLSS
ncbi:MAG: TetR/AcrR family transcriptional regulator [Proteobacteria bacterium]|nr:TetR/AcrR family transcriptional regulator [Pseudomonadota bacterium]